MTHFRMATPGGQEVFMAYKLAGTYYVRASICPPCRSQSFSLTGETLVCDSCGTVFNARTGAGVSGACVNYPKTTAAFQSSGGTLTVKTVDLINAYNETLKPG
jgi:nitrite reductase/ring-hydroxylating ferredoxin subunit